jgi:hypothetical protein
MMKRSRFTQEQIIDVLKDHEAGIKRHQETIHRIASR